MTESKKPKEEKFHYYAFSFLGTDIHGTANTTASVYNSHKQKYISYDAIQEAKSGALVKEDSVLIAVSYLGYMTKTQFGGSPVKKI